MQFIIFLLPILLLLLLLLLLLYSLPLLLLTITTKKQQHTTTTTLPCKTREKKEKTTKNPQVYIQSHTLLVSPSTSERKKNKNDDTPDTQSDWYIISLLSTPLHSIFIIYCNLPPLHYPLFPLPIYIHKLVIIQSARSWKGKKKINIKCLYKKNNCVNQNKTKHAKKKSNKTMCKL